jgi:hydrogenase nickel incorporation protein HypA/HybF
MHELGIVFHIIDLLEEVGKENQLEKISCVTLELGEVSSVID